MLLVNLYGDFRTEINAVEVAFDGDNTIVLVENYEDIPLEIRRWYTGDKKRLNNGSGGIRVGTEGSGLRLYRNPDGTYTITKLVPGWQPFRRSGSLTECVEWAAHSPFSQ